MSRPDPVLAADARARERIAADLDTNLLVEAGAGSGKTTALVGRMLALVARGTPVERIAAVTFTRKAAAELRERFAMRLERARGEAGDAALAARFDQALHDLDRAFLGTIHAFCARLLRERPLEIGLDPAFEEVVDADWTALRDGFWRRWLERAWASDDAGLRAVVRLGVQPAALAEAFATVVRYPDVGFPLVATPPPRLGAVRAALESRLDEARALLPREEPAEGWDELMTLVRRLLARRRFHDWSQPAELCAALDDLASSSIKATQKRWSADPAGRAAAKALCEAFLALRDGPVAAALRQWREHRYRPVMELLQRAAADFQRERLTTARLGFEDLLLLAARLLRERPRVRDALGERYRYLLVDEFQDTDPLQAEVCFLLASPAAEGTEWRAVTPRPGSLFVVGDPKQSIYRFRRADIQVYELVKARLHATGAVLALTRNFRSAQPIETVVNAHFSAVLPERATDQQAAFSPMRTLGEHGAGDGVFTYTVRPDGRKNKSLLLETDAAALASWIAARIARGERSAGDFLVLTPTKQPIPFYARALAERNVPATTTGAPLPQERELRELLVLLGAIADPENAVAVVAALEGLFCGHSPAALWDARQRGVRFALTHPPAPDEGAVAASLHRMHRWWRLSQRQPPDVLLERILEETGLLYLAASEPLGDARAGALLQLVAALRAMSQDEAPGLADAMQRIAVLLEEESEDAPLRPGRSDAVRIMNLHKAKGLEGTVVVLAAPVDETEHPPREHIARGADGSATGALQLTASDGNRSLVIAQPPGWEAMCEREQTFADAERDRLLYVAATRAKRELVVARCEWAQKGGARADCSLWSALATVLAELGTALVLGASPAPGRRVLARDAASIVADAEAAARRVRDAGVPRHVASSVTRLVKDERALQRSYDLPPDDEGPRGTAWGRAVHRTIEALGRGRRGAALRAFVRAVARDEGVEEYEARLWETVERVAASDAWQRLTSTGTPLCELPVMRLEQSDPGAPLLVEGVIDATARDADGWYVVDWKTDASDRAFADRRAAYEEQLRRYGAMLSELTGAPAATHLERLRGH